MGVVVADDAHVEVDGRRVVPAAEHSYFVMHKPLGVVTTMRDPERRRTVAHVLADAGVHARVVPVGRLDYDTSGVLLLTDDGEAANVLTHPRFGVEKMYRATVRGRLETRAVETLRKGARLDEGRALGAPVKIVAVRRDHSVVDMTIHEGRNRQVRRMFEAVGHPVVALTRLRFGPIALGELPVGAVRKLSARELTELRRIVSEAAAHPGEEAEDG